MINAPVIQLKSVSKYYRCGSETIHALQEATLSVQQGEFIAVLGHSGSGKTTLMNMIGCLDRPTRGTVSISGRNIESASEKHLTEIRRNTIGFVFQHFFLIPTLTVLQNVMLPGLFAREIRENRARELLDLVGLGKRLGHLPDQLSGGEMQRVAIARSLINDPVILLADEPTGNLDSHNAENIINMFSRFNRMGLTIVMVTHNIDIVSKCSRTVRIEDGRIHV
jgi:putative ABC transport system ATP-binding protein